MTPRNVLSGEPDPRASTELAEHAFPDAVHFAASSFDLRLNEKREAMTSPARPDTTEYAPYFQTYVSLVTEPEIMGALQSQLGSFQMLPQYVTGEMETQIHAPYSWTIRQVIGHLIDTERILAYRALRFAAGDLTPLPGFDQDAYVAATDYSRVTLRYLAEEMFALRQTSLSLFARFSDAAWQTVGEADGKPISVRAIAYVMAGHVRHHLRIIEQRVTQASQTQEGDG